MLDLCRIIFGIVVDLFRPRAALEAEIVVLRQQIIVTSLPPSGWPDRSPRRSLGGQRRPTWCATMTVPTGMFSHLG
jgi:hypothetical protein